MIIILWKFFLNQKKKDGKKVSIIKHLQLSFKYHYFKYHYLFINESKKKSKQIRLKKINSDQIIKLFYHEITVYIYAYFKLL